VYQVLESARAKIYQRFVKASQAAIKPLNFPTDGLANYFVLCFYAVLVTKAAKAGAVSADQGRRASPLACKQEGKADILFHFG